MGEKPAAAEFGGNLHVIPIGMLGAHASRLEATNLAHERHRAVETLTGG